MQCNYVAIQSLNLGDAVTLFFLNPALTALAAFILLRERLAWIGWLGVAVSLGGLLLLTRPPFLFGHGDQWDAIKAWGTAAGISSAVFAAAAFITIRIIGTREPALVLSMWFHTTAMVSSIPCLAASWPDPAVWPTVVEWVILTGIGLSSFSGQMVLSRGFQLLSGAKASGINMTQLVFGWFFGFVFFNEQLTYFSIGGSGLVAVGAIMVNLRQQRSRRDDESRAAAVAATAASGQTALQCLSETTVGDSVQQGHDSISIDAAALTTSKDPLQGHKLIQMETAAEMRLEETRRLLALTNDVDEQEPEAIRIPSNKSRT